MRGALAAAALAALGQAAAPSPEPSPAAPTAVSSTAPAQQTAGRAPLGAPCPAGTLPDNGVCIPAPSPAALGEPPSGPAPAAEDQIPRRPDRDADPLAYRWPITLHHPSAITPGGTGPSASATVGVTLTATGPAPVGLVALEGQTEPARVVHIGALLGPSVVTHHRVGSGGGARSYLAVYAGLDALAPGLQTGAAIGPATTLGQLSSRPTRLHFQVRLVRDGVRVDELGEDDLLDPSLSIATDPRNVLVAVAAAP